jgi:hypothetical protein
MHQGLFDDVVYTDYGQFDLVWSDAGGFDGDVDRFFSGQANGLVGAADPHGVYMNLARRSGGSRVQIVLLRGAPASVEEGVEDVVEVSVTVPPGSNPQWVTWAGQTSGALPGLRPGSYRMRVSAHGRDAGHQEEFAPGVVDEYLVQLWLSDPAPDELLRLGSEDAAYWHREVGGRRH